MIHLTQFLFAGARQKFAHRHDHGPDPFGGSRFGRAGRGGFGGRFGGRTRRGEGKFLVLDSLTSGPQHGYEIMSAIEEKHGFRPSPGSIYPTLQMLDDGGFVTSAEADGKRVYTITDTGRELLANRLPEGDAGDEAPDARQRAKQSAMKLMAAMMSARTSDDATLDKIRDVIDRARREIHTILATDEN